MTTATWNIELGREFGEPFTIHGVTNATTMAGYGVADRLRAELAKLVAARKAAFVEAIYDRAGFASNPHAKIRHDNLASHFVDRIIEGLCDDDFGSLMDWIRDLRGSADRALLAELDIPRMLDAGCALTVNAAASLGTEITDVALFFAELRQQLQGAYVRATIHPAEERRASARDRAARLRNATPRALVTEIARELGLGADACAFLDRVERFHTAGVQTVPPELLGKERPLSRAELELVAGHASLDAQLLARVEAARAMAAVELHRRDRWDGGSSTDGLRGRDIPLAARILAVVDAYESMVEDKRCTHEQALAVLQRDAGTRWDPRVVEAAVCLLRGGEEDEQHVRCGVR